MVFLYLRSFNKRSTEEKFYGLDVSPALRPCLSTDPACVLANKLHIDAQTFCGRCMTEVKSLNALNDPQLTRQSEQIDKEIPYHILFILTATQGAGVDRLQRSGCIRSNAFKSAGTTYRLDPETSCTQHAA